MALPKVGFDLGTVWVQVLPSYEGWERSLRRQAQKAGPVMDEELAKQEKATERGRLNRAEKAGEAEGSARAAGDRKARVAAERETAKAVEAAGDDIQGKAARRRAQGKEREQAADLRSARRHQERLDEIRERARASEQRAEKEHQNRLARDEAAAQRKADSQREASARRHQERLDEIRERARASEQRAEKEHQNRLARDEAAAQRKAADQRLRDRDRELKAQEKAELASVERRRKAARKGEAGLLDSYLRDPEGFKRKTQEMAARAREHLGETIELDVDSTEAEAEVRRIQVLLEQIRDGDIDIDVDTAGAIHEIVAISQQLNDLDREDVDVKVDVNTAAAVAELVAFERAARRVERSSQDGGGAVRSLDDATLGAANAMRSFNLVLASVLLLAPALVPALLAVAGALGAIATFGVAALGAVGAGLLGFSGIGNAVGAMNDLQDEQQYGQRPSQQRAGTRRLRDSGRAVTKARRGVTDARQGVVDAREDSVRRVSDAVRRQEQAERGLTRAQERARRAQQDLTRARQEARREIEDMNNALISGHLAEQDALYDLEEARYSLYMIQQDGSATEREKARAQLSYDIQEQNFKELQLQNRRLREDHAQTAAAGVEGSERVVAAQEAIVSANEGVVEAQRGVADAARGRAEAEADAARSIADAQQGVVDAEERLSDALMDAQEAALVAAEGTGALATQVSNLQKAMDGLSPAGQRFARYLFGLKPLLDQLRWTAQESMLPGVQAGMETTIGHYAPGMNRYVGAMGGTLGGLAQRAGDWMVQPQQQSFATQLGDYSLVYMEQSGRIVSGFLEGLQGVFEALFPFTERFGEALGRAADAFSLWANSEAGQEVMGRFFGYLERISPKVWDLFGEVLETMAKTFEGLAPYSEDVIELLDSFFGYLSEQDPETLGTWAANLIKAALGFQILAGAIAGIGSFAGLLSSVKAIADFGGSILAFFGKIGRWLGFGAVMDGASKAGGVVAAGAKGGLRAAGTFLMRFGPIGLALGAIMLGLALLYEHVEPFRDFVNAAFGAIGAVFTWLWREVIVPGSEWISLAFQIMWLPIEIVFKLFQVAIKALGMAFTWVADTMGAKWNEFYDRYLRETWETKIQPLLMVFGEFIDLYVRPKFEAAVKALGRAWDWLREMFRAPIEFVVNTVLNDGLIAGLNKVFDFFDVSPIGKITLPSSFNKPAAGAAWSQASAYAAGGVLPGWSPRTDDHVFYSPTGGVLHLGGGEGILVPEVTRLLGRERIEQWNQAAVAGGLSGAAKVMGEHRHAGGGILDWLGKGVMSTVSAIRDADLDVFSFLSSPGAALKKIIEQLAQSVAGLRPGTGQYKLAVEVPTGAVDMISDAIRGKVSDAQFSGGGGSFGSAHGIGGDWQTLWAQVGPLANALGLRLTSTVRPGARTAGYGTLSRHALGKAVDVAGPVPSMMAFSRAVDQMLPGLYEHIFSHLNGITTRYRGQRYTERNPRTIRDHWDHVHLSVYDQGGYMDPGQIGVNLSGRRERVLDPDDTEKLDLLLSGDLTGNAEYNVYVNVTQPGASADQIAHATLRELRRFERGGVR